MASGGGSARAALRLSWCIHCTKRRPVALASCLRMQPAPMCHCPFLRPQSIGYCIPIRGSFASCAALTLAGSITPHWCTPDTSDLSEAVLVVEIGIHVGEPPHLPLCARVVPGLIVRGKRDYLPKASIQDAILAGICKLRACGMGG